jgi:hypothetical protein
VRALELLGKHLGLFTDKVELTSKESGPVEFDEISRVGKIVELLAVVHKRALKQGASG